MDRDVISRLKQLMDYYNLNSLTLSNKLGYNSSEKISRLFRDGNAKSKPSFDILYDIANIFEINIDWLLTGRGEMLRDERVPEPVPANNIEDRLFAIIKEKDAKVEELSKEIGRLEQIIAGFDRKGNTAGAARIADAG